MWFARFFKSRTLASGAVSDGQVRINGNRCEKPSADVKSGDMLTFTAGDRVRVIKVIAGGTRRGPAPEAQLLYEDLTPPPEARAPEAAPPGMRDRGEGRPTKRDRRAIAALIGRDRED